MRRTLIALVLVCGFSLPLAALSTVRAQAEVAGAVALTVHASFCSIEDVNNPDVGLYDACHGNVLEGVSFTFDSLETDPVLFATGVDGVGGTGILDGISAASEVTLSTITAEGSYVYCADQIGGLVLYDGFVAADGVVPLFTIDSSQEVICDWFVYGTGAPVAPVAPTEEVVANG